MCVEVVVALVGVMLFLYLLAQSPGGRQGGVGVTGEIQGSKGGGGGGGGQCMTEMNEKRRG